MIHAGFRIDARQDTEPTTPWRAAAAGDADAAASRADEHVAQLRRAAVREAVQVLTRSTDLDDRQLRRDHVLALLAASVEKQAKVSGLGRTRIARLVVAS